MMVIERVDEWPRLLQDYIEACRYKPFVWGEHDCGIVTRNAFELITGQPRIDPALPRNSLRDYLRFVVKDPDGLRGLASKMFGFVPTFDEWQQARRGDMVLVESPRVQLLDVKQALGVSLGSNIAVPGLLGMEFLSLSSAVAVWRVGL